MDLQTFSYLPEQNWKVVSMGIGFPGMETRVLWEFVCSMIPVDVALKEKAKRTRLERKIYLPSFPCFVAKQRDKCIPRYT